MDTLVTCCLTVTVQVADTPDPSLAWAVMAAIPALSPSTCPSDDTNATEESELVHDTEGLEAVDGVTVAVKVTCSPV